MHYFQTHKTLLVILICAVNVLTPSCKPKERANDLKSKSTEASIEDLFTQSLNLYDSYFRDEASGLYFDRISLAKEIPQPSENISSAATGMGLISLALVDANGTIFDATAKAKKTLQTLIELKRTTKLVSKQGFYLHWFRKDGSLSAMSKADGYSTIDTAILAIGATLSAHYFAQKGQDQSLLQMTDELFKNTQWSDTIGNADTGSLVLKYELADEKPTKNQALPFNEYILIPCLAKNTSSQMKNLWNRHFASPNKLPKKSYQGIELLTDHKDHYIPHFTLQFAYYLCPDVAKSSAYQQYIKQAYEADRLWAKSVMQGQTLPLFGLGAGSSFLIDSEGGQQNTYTADQLGENKARMVSPAIMAGFAPFDSQNIKSDLLKLYKSKTCVYDLPNLSVLWRCSLLNVGWKVEGIEAVDFSTMVFGLATLQSPSFAEFFITYNKI